jgi:hypothetical protein
VNECTQVGPEGETWSQLTPCDGTSTSERWCCGNSTGCCDGSGKAVVLLAQTLAAFQATPTSTRVRSGTTNFASSTEIQGVATSTEASSQSKNGTNRKSGGLSVGAKAGIGVGAGVGALVLLGLGFFLSTVRQWKKAADAAKYDRSAEIKSPVQAYAPTPRWVENSPIHNPAGTMSRGHEIDGNVVNEAPNHEWQKSRNEMP